MPTTPVKAKRVSTFQEFESNTSDAWDAGEDDDELLAMAAESLNTEVVMETAHRVLRNHSQRQGRPALREAPGLQQKPRPEAEPPSPPSADLRLVKSVSESHTSCPAGMGILEGRSVWASGRAKKPVHSLWENQWAPVLICRRPSGHESPCSSLPGAGQSSVLFPRAPCAFMCPS
ncbi:hypothetical protein P7K49_003218 [Saguinus oedipus]|uniref:Uncharacterized protein n=1 Tax=Saguinus oedipus TaxID=9490 RepID=A0ABQ9WJJ2_SAGOE|nr:hypothetical protein P7K49_003218 [Saguinus oedipus]